jgi:Ca-activated chloride channel family protein
VRHYLARSLFGLCLGVLAWSICAQSPPLLADHPDESIAKKPPFKPPSEPTFGVDTTLVLVPVSVTDESNRYVLGLEKQNFHIFEDDSEQKISQFSGEDAPLSIGLLVDTSGSIGDKLELSRQAASALLKTMNRQDEAFLVEFNSRAKLAVPLTSNAKEIEQELKGVESAGYTALLDAVQIGLDEMRKAKGARKALIIISDGGDNISHYTPRQITSVVREADVQIYAMGVFEPSLYRWMSADVVGGPQLLADLSQQTGGRIFAVADDRQLPSVAEKIGIELRNQYLLAYSPANSERDGEYRKIRIKLDQPQGLPSLKARWRQGYYAPMQ